MPNQDRWIDPDETDKCPPHDWHTEEVKDKNGKVIGTVTYCKKCGEYL